MCAVRPVTVGLSVVLVALWVVLAFSSDTHAGKDDQEGLMGAAVVSGNISKEIIGK